MGRFHAFVQSTHRGKAARTMGIDALGCLNVGISYTAGSVSLFLKKVLQLGDVDGRHAVVNDHHLDGQAISDQFQHSRQTTPKGLPQNLNAGIHPSEFAGRLKRVVGRTVVDDYQVDFGANEHRKIEDIVNDRADLPLHVVHRQNDG
jgi:hypothetical protein